MCGRSNCSPINLPWALKMKASGSFLTRFSSRGRSDGPQPGVISGIFLADSADRNLRPSSESQRYDQRQAIVIYCLAVSTFRPKVARKPSHTISEIQVRSTRSRMSRGQGLALLAGSPSGSVRTFGVTRLQRFIFRRGGRGLRNDERSVNPESSFLTLSSTSFAPAANRVIIIEFVPAPFP